MKKSTSLADAQLSKIRWILDIEPEFRSHDHCDALIQFLKNGNYLEQGDFNSSDLTEFAKLIVKKVCQENEIVFKEKEKGDEFFIILKGKVEGYVEKKYPY